MNDPAELAWGPLIGGVLLRRYKRFLADVRLRNNHVVTAHCPNTGTMKTCSRPGRPVWLSRHDNPARKYRYTWEIIDMADSLVGVNTAVPNRLVRLGVLAGEIQALRGYDEARPEVRINAQTRLDLLLTGPGRRPCYVEVKNCTLVQQGRAEFPDAVTRRGRKHLDELADLVAHGARSVIFYLIQRMDASSFSPADAIDPEYGRTLRRAAERGVEVLAYDVDIDMQRIRLHRPLPVVL
jgi:sugar fermentation stimulation protein A